jgi:hypothetical protein
MPSQNNAIKVTPADARQRELLQTALCLLKCGGVAVHHDTGSEWTRNAMNDGHLVVFCLEATIEAVEAEAVLVLHLTVLQAIGS